MAFLGNIFPLIEHQLRHGQRVLQPERMYLLVAQGVGKWDGPSLANIPRETVFGIKRLWNARLDGNVLIADDVEFNDLPASVPHDSAALFEWRHNCTLRSPLIAWWKYEPMNGPVQIAWGDTRAVLEMPWISK